MPTKSKKIDLSYIYDIADGDREFIKEMFETFLKITPDIIQQIELAQSDKNWKEVGRLAHKIKPTLMLIGDETLSKKIYELEKEAKQGINTFELSDKFYKIKELCSSTIDDIKELIKTDTY